MKVNACYYAIQITNRVTKIINKIIKLLTFTCETIMGMKIKGKNSSIISKQNHHKILDNDNYGTSAVQVRMKSQYFVTIGFDTKRKTYH